MVDSIKKVSDRSPVINVTFNRREYNPVGSVSPDMIVQMSKRQTKMLNAANSHTRMQSQGTHVSRHQVVGGTSMLGGGDKTAG